MYKRQEDGKIVGVLNDFDLAIIGGSQSTNTERIGTMLFMALDMLENIVVNTDQVHLYRYDAESFLWVAIWVCGTYEGGGERRDGPFKDWAQGDAKFCRGLKLDFLTSDEAILLSKSHQTRVDLLSKIRVHLEEDIFTRRRQNRARSGVVQPETRGCTETDHKKIYDSLFSTLRKELGE